MTRTALTALKLSVYAAYGVSSTKDLRKQFQIDLDLRKPSSWTALSDRHQAVQAQAQALLVQKEAVAKRLADLLVSFDDS